MIVNVNTAPYEDGARITPLVNLDRRVFANGPGLKPIGLDRYYDVLHEHNRGLDGKNVFKETFGPQLKTVVYSNRHWVWTFESEGTVLNFLISVRGASVECHRSIDPDKAMKILGWVIDQIEKRLKTGGREENDA